jgi:hypothetical protein
LLMIRVMFGESVEMSGLNSLTELASRFTDPRECPTHTFSSAPLISSRIFLVQRPLRHCTATRNSILQIQALHRLCLRNRRLNSPAQRHSCQPTHDQLLRNREPHRLHHRLRCDCRANIAVDWIPGDHIQHHGKTNGVCV